jgi:mono/diheme cytochrome c family protein
MKLRQWMAWVGLVTGLPGHPVAAAQFEALTRADLQLAAEDFQNNCAPCHGTSAKGDGPAGQALKVRPADLTRIAARREGSFPEMAIFEMIAGLSMPTSHGSRDMPIWGDVFVDEAVGAGLSVEDAKRASEQVQKRIERLVTYLETIQAKP